MCARLRIPDHHTSNVCSRLASRAIPHRMNFMYASCANVPMDSMYCLWRSRGFKLHARCVTILRTWVRGPLANVTINLVYCIGNAPAADSARELDALLRLLSRAERNFNALRALSFHWGRQTNICRPHATKKGIARFNRNATCFYKTSVGCDCNTLLL